MSPDLWRKAEDLFHAALERSPESRAAFLDDACAGNSRLRREVEALLSDERAAGSFLEQPTLDGITATSPATGSLIGRQVGVYRVVAPLGAGGMGEVYRAHDSKLRRDVAIKTLPPEFARDPDRLARLRREALTLASLNHPNIAAIYGLEESGGVECLVLELVEGENLAGPLPPLIALDRAGQVAAALATAHAKGIIHRDLKPANVKVTPEGRVKVLDFGLAKAMWGAGGDADLSQRATVTGIETQAGRIVGTPGYMSPEQARGQGVDKRTDIWSFGCLLFELLTGKRVFTGDTASDTIAAILQREPEWQALPAKTPAKIRDLLRQCLQKDASRRLQDIASATRIIEQAQRGRHRWRTAAVAAVVVAAMVGAGALWFRGKPHPLDRSSWVQLTRLTDSASQPALSPDGRMLAFLRGGTWLTPGQLYVKVLPDGEPVQLTHDSLLKMSPVFSPDGSRVAYTARDAQFHWDTWVVPVPGGAPRPWLSNASGLIWSGPGRILFSEIKSGLHMGLVAAEENRNGARDVYLPENERGMVHRSYASPDGKYALLVEMNPDGLWGPCRLVPMDGSSGGRQVGPPRADCTFGAWSPDSKWIYLTSKAGGQNHIWRQRLPDGQPEQITSGPTEEEGIAMAPDGRSFVAAVALQTGSVWVHDTAGDRQVSLEGAAADPRFVPDGKQLCYRVVKSLPMGGSLRNPGEVWIADLESGRSEPVVAGFQAFTYDISADGRQVVMEAEDAQGTPHLWVAPLDRSWAPRQIPGVEGRQCFFGTGDEVFFRRTEGNSGFVYRVHADGTGLRKAIDRPILILFGISPDAKWLLAWAALPDTGLSSNQAIPLDGGPSIPLGTFGWAWSAKGHFMSIGGGNSRYQYFVPLPPVQSVPAFPAAGPKTEKDLSSLPGAQRIDSLGADRSNAPLIPGPSMDVYTYPRTSVQRNLYRIPIP